MGISIAHSCVSSCEWQLIVASLSELRLQSALFYHPPIISPASLFLCVLGPVLHGEVTSMESRWLPVGRSDGSARVVLSLTNLDATTGGHINVSTAQGADKVGAVGGLGLDIIRGDVHVGAASHVRAARDGGLAVVGVDLVDTIRVLGVDDGRDVEVGQTSPAVEGDLAQHAHGVGGIGGNGIPVANPSIGEVDGDGVAARDSGVIDTLTTRSGSEVDSTVRGVHGLEGDLVGSACQSGRGKEGKSAEEHVDGGWWLSWEFLSKGFRYADEMIVEIGMFEASRDLV